MMGDFSTAGDQRSESDPEIEADAGQLLIQVILHGYL